MTSQQFNNLVKAGRLKEEPCDQAEFDGLVHSGRVRLEDAKRKALSLEGRFDLAYNASHALALAAMRWKGYRPDRRYIVFQCLEHTLGLDAKVWKILDLCHTRRNRGEYEGFMDINEQLVQDLITATEVVLTEIEKLGPVP
jgi:hypothetical protein